MVGPPATAMDLWYTVPVGGFIEDEGLNAIMSGNQGSRPDLDILPQESYLPTFAEFSMAPPPASHDAQAAAASSYQNSVPSAAPHPSRPPVHTFCPHIAAPAAFHDGLDESLQGLPSLLRGACSFSPFAPCRFASLDPLPGTGFPTSPAGPAAAPQPPPAPATTSTVAPDPASLSATSTTQPQPPPPPQPQQPPAVRSSRPAHNVHFAAPSPPRNNTAIDTALLFDCIPELPPRLSQSSTEANAGDAFSFAGPAAADSASTRHGSLASLFSSPNPWDHQSPSLAATWLPSSIPRNVVTEHHPYPGLDAQGETISLAAEPHGRARRPDAQTEERGYDDPAKEGDNPAFDSLLDAMPPTNHRKRTRTAAALDDTAGPSSIKRRRSHSSRASVSGRSAGSKSRRSIRGARPVAIPDSDDVFVVDDEEDPRLYDLTKDDRIPEELMAPPPEDNSTRLSAFECIICMDSATNLTVTHCGHLFCGQCLHQAMHAEVTKKICPMCRQKLELRPKAGAVKPNAKTFFHLELKLKPTKKQGKQPVRR